MASFVVFVSLWLRGFVARLGFGLAPDLVYGVSRGVDMDGTGIAQAMKKLMDYLETQSLERHAATR